MTNNQGPREEDEHLDPTDDEEVDEDEVEDARYSDEYWEYGGDEDQ